MSDEPAVLPPRPDAEQGAGVVEAPKGAGAAPGAALDVRPSGAAAVIPGADQPHLGPGDVPEKRRVHFPLFDGFRGIAAAMVVLLHVSYQTGADRVSGWGAILGRFDVGVPIFFAISGFLLYRPFVVDHLNGRIQPGFRAFYWRRVLRIFPAYWIYVTACAVWFHTISIPFGTGNLHTAKVFTYTYGLLWTYRSPWVQQNSGLFNVWSLNTEVGFYFVLPFLAIAIGWVGVRFRHVVGCELIACTVLFLLGWGNLAWLTWTRPSGSVSTHWVTALIQFFVIGMFLAVLSAAPSPRLDKARRALGRGPMLWWGIAAAAVLVTSFGLGLSHGDFYAHTGPAQYMLQQAFYAIAAGAFVIPGVFGDQNSAGLRRVVRHRAVVYFGIVSYFVFLWHDPLVTRMIRVWHWYGHMPGTLPIQRTFVLFAAVMVVTTAAAIVSWEFIEEPIMRLKSWGPGRRGSRRG